MTSAGAGRAASGIDSRDDQRHVQRRLVGEHAVGQLAVLAEALAVVRGDDDERRARERREAIEQRAERAIDERDLAVVRLRAVLRREIRRAACTASADRRRGPSAKNCAGCWPIQSSARDTTTSARRSGIEISIAPRVSGIWSS